MNNIQTAFSAINQSFINGLKSSGVNISEECYADVGERSIEVGLLHKTTKGPKSVFSSQVHIYYELPSPWDKPGTETKITLSVSSCGSFSPSDEGPFWKTVHAAGILQNWDKIILLVASHCGAVEKIYAQVSKIV